MRTLVRVVSGNRITIPKEFLAKMQVKQGESVILEEEDTVPPTLRIIPAEVKPRGT